METKRQEKDQNSSNRLTKTLFTAYFIVLVWILLFKLGVRFSYMGTRSFNLIPFGQLFLPNARVDKVELVLNVLVFIPLGIYTGVLFDKWTWRKKLFFFFLISLLFEGLQFVFRIGAFDSTDIVNNVVGALTGLLIFEAIEKLFNNSMKSRRLINQMGIIGTAIIISLLVLLKLNMLPIRYQ